MVDATSEAGAGAVDLDALVQEHLHLVQHIVNQLASGYPRHVDRGELWSAGAYGLVAAAKRYDPATGVPFARYATIRIRGAIIDSTRTRDLASRGLRRSVRDMNTASERFEAEQGRAPREEELAELLGMAAEDVAARRNAAVNTTVLQLDMPISGADGETDGTLGDRLAETADEHLPEQALEHREVVGTLRDAITRLDPVRRQVVERHFFGGELLRDIAASMGCTEARVSQIRSEALHSLQAAFGGLYEGVPAVPDSAPGRRRRAAYVAELAAHSTWHTRMAAAAERTPLSA